MKQKSNNLLMWIIGGIMLALLFLSKNKLSSQENQDINIYTNQVENNKEEININKTHNPFITLQIIPNEICVGQNVNGNIKSNIPNTNCKIYYKPMFSWIMYKPIKLDMYGNYEENGEINIPANVKFYAECDYNNKIIKSNTEELKIIQC